MKKIIATVLAMVMAMALCVTAFAVNYSDGYYFANGKWNKIDLTKVSVSYTNPSETKTDGKVVSAKIGYYTLKETGKADVVLVEVDKDDATYQIKADSTVKYLQESNGNQDKAYTLTGTKLTSSDKCGEAKFTGTVYQSGDKYYTTGSSNTYMLIDGQVVSVVETTVSINGHDFEIQTKAVDAKGVLTGTAKCKNCTQTATLTNKLSTIPVGAKSQVVSVAGMTDTCYLYWTEAGKTNNGSSNANSPKTFDAGVAMYAGMALMSVAGSAVVIGKKKEF